MCGSGGRWEISLPFTQFCCVRKTALKNKVLLFFKEDKGTQRDTEKSSKRTELEGRERDRKEKERPKLRTKQGLTARDRRDGRRNRIRDQTESEKLTEKEKQIDPDKQTERD